MEAITDAPADVFSAGRRLFAGTTNGDPPPDGQTLTIAQARPLQGGVYIVHFEGFPDRTHAERWRDRYLLLPREELRPPGEAEVYYHELVGMRVALSSGEDVGDVVQFFELPQGLALEVAWRHTTVILPFREEFVDQIDPRGRRIVMTLPDGLLE